MPKRLSKQKKSADPNQAAFQAITKFAQTANADDDKPTRSEISRIMAAMGRKGGKKSAKTRMELLTPKERSDIALKAARARWANKPQQPIGNTPKLK